MIFSMTGYAVKTLDIECGTLQLEFKSVNSRYLDFHFRIAEDLRSLEIPLRELLSSRLSRGKIECRLGFNSAAARADQLQLNQELFGTLKALNDNVRIQMPEARPLSVSDVLRWPGMFGEQGIDFSAVGPQVLALAREVLEEFSASRSREGKKLGDEWGVTMLELRPAGGGEHLVLTADLEARTGTDTPKFDPSSGKPATQKLAPPPPGDIEITLPPGGPPR